MDLADRLTSLGGAATLWPLSFSFCIMTVSTFSPNTLDLPKQRGGTGEPCCGRLCGKQAGTGMDWTPVLTPVQQPQTSQKHFQSGRPRLLRHMDTLFLHLMEEGGKTFPSLDQPIWVVVGSPKQGAQGMVTLPSVL